MSSLDVYLLFTAGKLTKFFTIFSIMYLFLAVTDMLFFIHCIDDDCEDGIIQKMIKQCKKYSILFVVFTALALITPSTKDLVLMYGIPKIINSTELKTTTSKVYQFVDLWITHETKQLKELQK